MRTNYSKTPHKVRGHVLSALKRLRAEGKSYRLCGDLAGVGVTTAFLWLTGRRPLGGQREE